MQRFPSPFFFLLHFSSRFLLPNWIFFRTRNVNGRDTVPFAMPSSKHRQIYSILKIIHFHSVLCSRFFWCVCVRAPYLNLLTEQQASYFVRSHTHIMAKIILKWACHTCLLHASHFPVLTYTTTRTHSHFSALSFSLGRLLHLHRRRHRRPSFIQALQFAHLFQILLKQKYPMYYIYHGNKMGCRKKRNNNISSNSGSSTANKQQQSTKEE